MLNKYIIELSDNPSFWYFVSFILFITIFSRPFLKLCNNLIQTEQDKLAKQLTDAQAILTQAQSNLHKAEIKTYDLSICVNEIMVRTDQEIRRLQEHMHQQIEDYKIYHQKLLQQKLRNFEMEEMHHLREAYIKSIMTKITNNINLKIDKSIDYKICQFLINNLTS